MFPGPPETIRRVMEVLAWPRQEHPGSYWHHRHGDDIQNLNSACTLRTAELIRRLQAPKQWRSAAVSGAPMMRDTGPLPVSTPPHAFGIEREEEEDRVAGETGTRG